MTTENDDASRCPICGCRLVSPYQIIVLELSTVYRYQCEECREKVTVTLSTVAGRSIDTIPVRDNLL